MSEKNTSIKNDNVVHQVINVIVDAIISGKYSAGMKIPNEYELIDELGVSRNSLREAIKILSALGILEIRRGDGTYVCSEINPTIFDTAVYSIIYEQGTKDEMNELRQIIDEEILRLAVEKATDDEIRALNSNIEEMQKALQEKKYTAAAKLDFEFHLMLIDCSKNKLFIRITKGIYSIFEKTIRNTVEYEKELSEAPKEHKILMKCIEEHDMDGVHDAVAHSLRIKV